MKERPIPFTTAMVHAILDGRKTMTRRIVKSSQMSKLISDDLAEKVQSLNFGLEPLTLIKTPYGEPGDQLWVKETFTKVMVRDEEGWHIVYKADGQDWAAPWTSSRFMPRTASRINLLIKATRLERLQDISKQDAINEGIDIVYDQSDPLTPLTYFYPCKDLRDGTYICDDPILSFCSLWKSIYGPDSWEMNPWVWVIEFERIT